MSGGSALAGGGRPFTILARQKEEEDVLLGRMLPASLLLTLCAAWVVEGAWGGSLELCRGVGAISLALVGGALIRELLRDPACLCRPVIVFLVGSIYYFMLDMAVLREMEDFSPKVILITYTLCDLFVAISLFGWGLFRMHRSPLERLLRAGDVDLDRNLLFWAATLTLALELFKRLAFCDWNLSEFLWETVQSRALGFEGGRSGRGIEGDWRVVLQPIEIFFWAVPFLADRAVRKGVSPSRRIVLGFVVSIQVLLLVLAGSRGLLVLSLGMPIFARAAERAPGIRRLLWGMVFASFVLAPLFDVMVKVRGLGWENMDKVEDVNWNMAGAHRDDNLFWAANLVDVLERGQGVVAYKGPLGVVDGVSDVICMWGMSIIPRFLWPDKPSPTDFEDESHPWNVSSSAVGDFLRSGGLAFLFVASLLFGFAVRLLEPLYAMRKGDGALLQYGYLLMILLAEIRWPLTFQFGPIAFAVLWAGCFLLRHLARRRGGRSISGPAWGTTPVLFPRHFKRTL